MNIAIINQNGGRYLFEVPENITLKEGDRVKCDTRRGITDGVVFCDSAEVEESAAKLIGKLLGAKFPLKSVVGKTVTSVEMFEQPEQPKQEPVKLYCVKDPEVSWVKGSLTKGKVYEFNGHRIKYDCGTSAYFNDLEDWKRGDPNYAACLVPLVSRPAQVGEWVYVTHTVYSTDLKVGDIAKVKRVNTAESVFISKPDGYHQNGLNFSRHEYLVLDGYKPEPEKAEPEYYSGKVVCAKATDIDVTIGKVYSVENGVFTWDSGTRSNTKAPTIEQFNNWFIGAKFIEFKGE